MTDSYPGGVAPSIETRSVELIDMVSETPWPLAVVAPDGRMLVLSIPLLGLLGAEAEALLNRPLESLFLSQERAQLRGLLDRDAHGPIKAHLHQPGRIPVAVEVEALPIPEDLAGRVAITINPVATLRRGERLILEFNLLAASLLAAQSADEVYHQVMQVLRPLGIGMLMTSLEPDGATLRVDYASIGSSVATLLRAAHIDITSWRVSAAAPLFAEALAQSEPHFATSLFPLLDFALPAAAAAVCRNMLRLVGMPGCILAPFQAGERDRGVLMVWGQALNREDLPFISAFAHQIGTILAQIKLRRQMETQVQRLNSLATTAHAVTTLGSLDEVLRVICVQAQQLLGAKLARIAAPVPGTGMIKYIMATGTPVGGLMDMLIPIDSSVTGRVLRSGQGRLIDDLQADSEVYPAVKGLSTARSVLYQPLQHQGTRLGVLIVGSDRPGSFDQADLDHLGRYAEYAAVAIANARLHEALQQSELEQQRQSRELGALLDLSRAVNHSLDLSTVLQAGLQVLEDLDLANVSTVLLVNARGDGFDLHASRGVPDSLLPAIQHSSLDTISGQVLQDGRLRVLTRDELQQMLDQYGITGHFQHQTSVYVPLIVDERRLGVLGVCRPDERPYAERELWLLQALANHLAQAAAKAQTHQAIQETAVLNARLYREAEEVRSYLNTLIHTTPDLLIIIRPDMTLHLLNPERIGAAGMHYPELLEGRSLLDVIRSDRRAELLERWQQVLDGHPQSVELSGHRDNGLPYNVLISAALIAEYGEVFAIVKDVTEQRQNETQIRQNEQLAALGRTVAGTAHELNNPLAAILGLAQLQLTGDLAPDLRTDLERIERSALRARSIVQQLLTFARAQRPEPQPVAIGAIIRDVLERLAATIARERVQVAVELAPDLPAVRGDPHQLEQVLFNIMHNALQALSSNPPGAARVVRIQVTEHQGMLRLAIADSGPGIPPQHIARVFEPFFTTRAIGEGTGLGLAITHAIVQQHQGQIHVTSKPGQSTTFTIDLPIADRQARPIERPAPPAPAEVGTRILLVEDEEMVRSVVTRTLTRRDYQVDAVGSGEAALELALARDYALVISDLQMPRMDGPALYERLRQERPSLRWLIVTGDTMGERSHAFLERTGLPALPKPFTQEQLLTRVAECLAGERRAGERVMGGAGDGGSG